MGVLLAGWLAGGGSEGGGGGRAATEKPAVCERAAERGKRKSERRAARHASPHRHCRSEYHRLCCRSVSSPPPLCCRSPLLSALSSPSFSLQCLLFVIIVCYSVFYVCTDVFICHVVSETPACHWQLTFGLNLKRAESCWCWFWCWCLSPGSSDLCCCSVFSFSVLAFPLICIVASTTQSGLKVSFCFVRPPQVVELCCIVH